MKRDWDSHVTEVGGGFGWPGKNKTKIPPLGDEFNRRTAENGSGDIL